MRRGALFADICDTTECINNALKEGYHLCTENEKLVREEELKHSVRKHGGKPRADVDPKATPPKAGASVGTDDPLKQDDPLGGKPQK